MAPVKKREYLKGKSCLCCGATRNLTVDHILPSAFGFTLDKNKQPLCNDCNVNKGILPIDFASKTIVILPFMLRLNEDGLRELFSNTRTFSCNLLNPTYKRSVKKYSRQ
jgi:hypothetical protein